MKKTNESTNEKRILARRVARPMTQDELQTVTGGTTSCSCGGADDCDQQMN